MTHAKPNIKKELKRAWKIALMEKATMHHVAEGGKAETTFGYYVIIAATILTTIGQHFFISWFKPTLIFSMLSSIFHVIFTIIGIYVLSFIAKKVFKGKASHSAFFRVMAFALIVTWINIVPSIAIIGGIWMLILLFVILKTIHHLKTSETIVTIILSAILLIAIGTILSPLAGVAI